MDIFESCHTINDYLIQNEEAKARDELIKLLDYHATKKIEYSEAVNHFIRQTGLYPYLNSATANWQDKFVYEAFKVNIGTKEFALHREQSDLLKAILDGKNVAVSAPTSFGKSFIVDAFITIKKPKNVVIIVPTIALTDETRRRIYKKFGKEYKIITTTDVDLGERNILIFPQERSIAYINKLEEIDVLIIDEFYKASAEFDKERSPALLKAIIKLGKKAKQKYFLAPNISGIKDNVFTRDMIFLDKLNFNTVYLEKYELYKEINDEEQKSETLLKIINGSTKKSLIYAGTYSNIEKVSNLIIDRLSISESKLLNDFAQWLTINYSSNWKLTNLIKRGCGIHNGELHRSLTQIQVKLFEDEAGINNIVSTSSIIEGVNTSAENVILWRNRNGQYKLNDFTYKNIIGRGGRMFKHFIGKIYLLEAPPQSVNTQLEIEFPDTILGDIDEETYKDSLTDDQVTKIISFKKEMYELLGKETYDRLIKDNSFKNSNSDFIITLAREMRNNPNDWNGLAYLNSANVNNWDRLLHKIIYLQAGIWDIEHYRFVGFVKILTSNWQKSIPDLLDDLEEFDIDIDTFFKLERNTTFKLASLLSDVNTLQKHVFNNGVDISSFVARVSHAFLPSAVYQLEEYGLPRSIAKKIQNTGLVNFEDDALTIHGAIQVIQRIGKDAFTSIQSFNDFDRYIFEYFFDGISFEE